MQRFFLILATLLIFSGIAHAESYSDRWTRLVLEHYRLIKNEPGKSYEVELINAHNRFWRDVYKMCNTSAQKAKIESFSGIAVIDSDGYVIEFLTMPRSQHLGCYRKAMVGKRYPNPPVAPFYELYKIGIETSK